MNKKMFAVIVVLGKDGRFTHLLGYISECNSEDEAIGTMIRKYVVGDYVDYCVLQTECVEIPETALIKHMGALGYIVRKEPEASVGPNHLPASGSLFLN